MFISEEKQRTVLSLMRAGRLRLTEDGVIEQKTFVRNQWKVVNPTKMSHPTYLYASLFDEHGRRFPVREDFVRDLLKKGDLLDPADYPSHGEKIRKTLQERGGSPNAVLSDDDVFRIRWAVLQEGRSFGRVAKEYGVSDRQVRRIVNNESRVQN